MSAVWMFGFVRGLDIRIYTTLNIVNYWTFKVSSMNDEAFKIEPVSYANLGVAWAKFKHKAHEKPLKLYSPMLMSFHQARIQIPVLN